MDADFLTIIANYGVPGILCLVLLNRNKKQSDEFVKCAKLMAKSLNAMRDAIKELTDKYD